MPLRQLRCKAKKVKPKHKVASLFKNHVSNLTWKNVSTTMSIMFRARFLSGYRSNSQRVMVTQNDLSGAANRQTINANRGHAHAYRHALTFLTASANPAIKLQVMPNH